MTKLKMIYYMSLCLLFVVVGALVVNVNPTVLTREALASKLGTEYRIWNLVRFDKDSESSAGSIKEELSEDIFYRQDQARSARFLVKSFDLRLKKVWSSEHLNVGNPGAAKSSPISDGTSIFVGSDTSWFYCYDLNGHLRWRFYFGNSGPGVQSTAAVDSEAVYIGSYRGTFYKINKMTGELIWSRIMGQTIGASPLAIDNYIVLSEGTNRPDGYLVKIDRDSGELAWKSDFIGERSHSSVAFDKDSQLLIFGANNSTVQAIDYKTGKRIYSLLVHGQIKSTPVIHQGVGYFTSWGKDFVALDIKAGTLNWNYALEEKSQVSPVVLRNKGIVVTADASGNIYAVEADHGRLLWKIKNDFADFNQSSSPIVLVDQNQQEMILFQCKPSVLCLISDSGAIKRTWPLSGRLLGDPFVGRDFIVLNLDGGGLEFFRL